MVSVSGTSVRRALAEVGLAAVVYLRKIFFKANAAGGFRPTLCTVVLE